MKIGYLESNKFDSQFLFFENYQKDSLIKIRNDLKLSFEKIDQEIFNSKWRKENGYIPDGFKSRTIRTIYGAVTFKRRVYKHWEQTKYSYVFLADKKLEIEKYTRVTSHLKFKILEQIATGKRQRDIGDMFSHANLTRATISNIIKLSSFQKSLNFLSKTIEKVKIPEYLYVNIDETFIKLRKNRKMKKYRIRLVTFHTGYDKKFSTKKRKVVASKRVFCQLLPIAKRIDTFKFMLALGRIARKFYSNVSEAKIIIGGDGAAWIREISNYWLNSNYVLDKFHAVRHLKRFFPNQDNRVNYQHSKELFELGKYQDLIIQLNQLKKISLDSKRDQKVEKIISYFINNNLGVSNQKLEWNIGVSAEGDISHIIKWLLGYGSKAFNYKTFINMLSLRIADINHLDLIAFLKSQCQLKAKAQNFY